MSYGSVPPPSSISSNYPQKLPPQSSTLSERKMIKEHLEKQYDDLISSSKKSSEKGPTKKPFLGHDEYFDRESDEEDNETGGNEGLDRLQIPQRKKEFSYGGVGEGQDDGRQTSVEDEEEDDPLDAFMSTIDRQAQADKQESTRKEQKAMESNECSGGQTGRDDIEQDDMQESYFKFMEEYKSKHDNDDDDEQYEYDEDGNIIWSWKKEIEPLPPIDHSQISYRPFCKSTYTEHPDIASLTPKKVFELRVSLDIRVFGRDIPKPVTSFAHFSFDKSLLGRVQKSDFEKPTPIQAQAIPIALQGRDVLGLAKTGSGKTAAYLWPAICHILNQEELDEGDGPIALIVIPTRELSIQVYQQASFYCKPFGISIVCAYGGGSKYEQSKELAGGAELVICTPGRIIDLIKCKATNFLRTTFLVLPESEDILLMDVFENVCEELYKKTGIRNLTQRGFNIPPFPVEGWLYGTNRRMVPLICKMGKKPPITVWFIVDTGSPVVFLSSKTYTALMQSEDFFISPPHPVSIQALLIASIGSYQPLSFNDTIMPSFYEFIGWIVMVGPLLIVPFTIVSTIYDAKRRNKPLKNVLSSENWRHKKRDEENEQPRHKKDDSEYAYIDPLSRGPSSKSNKNLKRSSRMGTEDYAILANRLKYLEKEESVDTTTSTNGCARRFNMSAVVIGIDEPPETIESDECGRDEEDAYSRLSKQVQDWQLKNIREIESPSVRSKRAISEPDQNVSKLVVTTPPQINNSVVVVGNSDQAIPSGFLFGPPPVSSLSFFEHQKIKERRTNNPTTSRNGKRLKERTQRRSDQRKNKVFEDVLDIGLEMVEMKQHKSSSTRQSASAIKSSTI